MKAGQFNNTHDARNFITGGNATVTLRSVKTNTRYTFTVAAPWDKEKNKRQDTPTRFVSLLVGSDNTSDFAYIGMIGSDGTFRATRATKDPNSTPFKAFAWVWAHLNSAQDLSDKLEIWHEGKCGRCGRKLTVPESIASGFGPECIHKVAE